MPPITLTEEAQKMLVNYRWQGNVRQLKNITEQMSIIEKEHEITADVLRKYLPSGSFNELPVLYKKEQAGKEMSERDLLYKVLFEYEKGY